MPKITTGLETVYRERHHLVAHLAAAYPSVMVLNADPDEPDWPVIYVTLPTGQVSWHIAPADMDLFRHVPIGAAEWDGSDVMEKYRRLDEHTRQLAEEVPAFEARMQLGFDDCDPVATCHCGARCKGDSVNDALTAWGRHLTTVHKGEW